MSFPKFSVVTVTLNNAAHLEETLGSVFEQGYPALESVIIDGGSTDGTLDIVQKYRSRLAHFVSEPDQGISDAFNKGIRAATGEIIGIVSADDYLLPGALSAVAECYVKNGRPDVVHGNCLYLDAASGARSLARPDASLRSAFFGQPLKHGATFVANAAYEQHGLFDLRYKCAMDYDLVLRLIVRGGRFVYLARALAVVRSGGVNVRRRALTRLESRDIAVRHGCPYWKAQGYLGWKVFKDAMKAVLALARLHAVATAYRKLVGKNVPVTSGA